MAITMKNVGIMSVQYVHYSFDYTLASIERAGISNIDIWGGAPHYCRLDYKTSEEAAKKILELRNKMDAHGLKACMYTPETLAYPYSFSSPETAIRNRTFDYFDMATDDALNFGTNKVFLNTGCGLLDLPREESWKRCGESFAKICEMGDKKGITFVLEQLQPYESNLVTTLPDLKRMLDEVNAKNMKACVDLVAMAVKNETLEQYYEVLGDDMIEHIHFADGDPSGHYILGDGNLPLKHYIDVLNAHGYDKSLDLEINDSIYWDDPHTSTQRSADWLREVLPE